MTPSATLISSSTLPKQKEAPPLGFSVQQWNVDQVSVPVDDEDMALNLGLEL